MTARSPLAAWGAALMLCACSHAMAPPSAQQIQDRQRNATHARQEITIGVHAYGHHAYKIALSHFDRAVVIDPVSLEARYDRGLTEEKLHAYKHAETDLYDVVHQRPQWTGARTHLAAAQYRAHHFAASARNFDIVLRANPKDWRLSLDDGVSYYQLGRYVDARRHFARALVLSPKSGRAHFWLGMAERRLGDAAKARSELALAAHSRDVVVRMAARRQLAVR